MDIYSLCKFGVAYMQSYVSYIAESKPAPFSASFSVTNRCNLHCSYCDMPGKLIPELTLVQIEELFKRLKSMGVERLGLLGGEPLFRKDIVEIVQLAKVTGFSTTINSNLLLYNKYKKNLDSIDYFYTSIDGTPEKHQKNRGNQPFNKILESTRDIINNGQKLTAICVVTDPDYESADFLLNLAEKEKISIHFQPECFDAEYSRRNASNDINNKAFSDFWHYLYKRKLDGARISSSAKYLEYISNWKNFATSVINDPNSKCAAGRGFLYVDASGFGFPCAYTTGMTKGINMLIEDWSKSFKKTPCTKCIVGPMLEFNLLFSKPIPSIVNAIKNN
jgi:MoaA/NifB/PqqE/SkfB family radical SAM enzyme